MLSMRGKNATAAAEAAAKEAVHTSVMGGERFARLSLYSTPPAHDVALEDFERSAIDRLRVLKGIEDAQSRGTKPDEMEAVIQRLQDQHLRLTDPVTNRADKEGETKDAVSHYVLRLAYCRTDELRRWLLTQECTLFKYRFRKLQPSAQTAFLVENSLPYQPLPASEFTAVKDKLETIHRAMAAVGPLSTFYRVPFEEVCDLVRSRRVYLVQGQAYVPQESLASLVVGIFRSRLSKALAVTARQWSAKLAPMEMDRLTPIVESLSSRHLGSTDYSQERHQGVVTLQDLDSLAARSFPLCMSNLMSKLKEEHHLRHFGRMQLGLFLKAIGLTLEDAMTFWKSEFTKRMPVEKFEKQYAYNVRHNYGKEGKRADYTPYSCVKIIMSTPGHGDHHGCPYKHWTDDNVRAALGRLSLSSKAVNEVLEKKRNNHYQLACQAAFEGAHSCSCDSGINHPNQYFEESRKAIDGDAPVATPVTPGPEAHPRTQAGPTLSGIPAMTALASSV